MDPLFYENLLVRMLFTDVDCRDRIYPYLVDDIFEGFENQKIVQEFLKFKNEYDDFPSAKALELRLQNVTVFDHLKHCLQIDTDEYNNDYVMDTIEEFFRNKLVWNDINDTVEKLKENDTESISSIVDRMRDSLSFSFDTTVGLDYSEDAELMYEALHNKDNVVPTGIKNLDKLIEGGFHEKSLTLFMAETNMGKSLIKCGLATNALLQNKNVLYVTMEMSEFKIAERITANIMDIELDHLKAISKDKFIKKHEKVFKQLKSNLVVKEFPTKGANTNKIRNLLKELKLKKGFVPDIVFVDYLGIMLPNSPKKEGNTNTEMKTISEELRGLAVETGIPFVSAMQTNRGGFSSAEIDLTDVADSIGTTATADVIFGVTQTEEMRQLGIYTMILLKNRYGINKVKTSVGVDYPKMRIEDVEDEFEEETVAQPTDIVDDAVMAIKGKLKDNKKSKIKKTLDLEF